MVDNWLVEGKLYHERLKPFNYKFYYDVFYLKFPISAISSLKNFIFSLDSFNLFSLHSKDYLDCSARPLEVKIREVLQAEGINALGGIVLHTTPRLLGCGFNPVSFWYAYNKAGNIEAILSEVNNTFGDRHYYLLLGHDAYKRIPCKKILHVSPFFKVEGEYHFSFNSKTVVINYFDSQQNDYFFKSSISAVNTLSFSVKNLLRLFFKYPMSGFMVTSRIHLHALILYFKKANFYKRPPPAEVILTKEISP